MDRALVDDDTLAGTDVVANNTMNRDRGLRSYQRELSFDILAWLGGRHRSTGATQRWLDVCCGTGRALEEAAALADDEPAILVTGVDLVAPVASTSSEVEIVTASIATWEPPQRYDLITCVHGLHYLGDKLSTIARLCTWLTDDGHFVASFDARSIRDPSGASKAAAASALLTSQGLAYNSRRRLLHRDGRVELELGGDYLGADAADGPNYTGQPAVASYYRSSPTLG